MSSTSRSLPPRPSLEFLKKQAKDLLAGHRAGDPATAAVIGRLARFQGAAAPTIHGARVSLQEVQHALALHYGFESWKQLADQVRPRTAGERPHDPQAAMHDSSGGSTAGSGSGETAADQAGGGSTAPLDGEETAAVPGRGGTTALSASAASAAVPASGGSTGLLSSGEAAAVQAIGGSAPAFPTGDDPTVPPRGDATDASSAAARSIPPEEDRIRRFLGDPVRTPPDLDPRYHPAAMAAYLSDLLERSGYREFEIRLEDSEFPALVGARVRADLDYPDIKQLLANETTSGYVCGGCVSNRDRHGIVFMLNMIPQDLLHDLPDGHRIHSRMLLRLDVLYDEIGGPRS